MTALGAALLVAGAYTAGLAALAVIERLADRGWLHPWLWGAVMAITLHVWLPVTVADWMAAEALRGRR